ncbi:hypothetical protein ACVFYP_18790 [Roseomonas sp. F4]
MPITLAQIQNEMVQNTAAFLRHYRVMISGNHYTSGETEAWFTDWGVDDPGFTTGLSGLLGRVKQRPRIVFDIGLAQPGHYAGGGTLRIWFVRMQQMNEQPVDTHFTLPRHGGPDIMFTSLLSGCTFGVGMPSGGAQIVSHIQGPNVLAGTDDMDGAALNPTVQAGLTDGVRAIFARNQGYAYRAAVIGIRRDGNWRFFAQTTRVTGAGEQIAGAAAFA